MEIKNSNSTSIISISQFKLGRLENSLSLIQKILTSRLEDMFNQVFILLNSLYDLDKKENYLRIFESEEFYSKKCSFRFYAKNENDYIKALDILNILIDENPRYSLLYTLRGISKQRLGEYSEALLNCSKAIEINPNNAMAYYWRGEIKGNRDRTNSIQDISAAIEIEPYYVDALLSRGSSKKYWFKDYLGAIHDYNLVIEIEPNYADSYYFRGLAKKELKKFKEAFDDFTIAIGLEIDSYNFYSARALVRDRLKDIEGSIQDYTEAIDLLWIEHHKITDDDNDASEWELGSQIEELRSYYLERGKLKEKLQDESGLTEDFLTVINLTSNNRASLYFIYYSLGKVKENQNNLIGAIKDYSMAISHLIDWQEEIENSANYFYRSASFNDYHSVTLELKRLLLKLKSYYHSRGKLKGILEDYEGAIKDYSEAVKIYQSEDAYLYYARGNAKFKLNKLSEAMEDFSEAIVFDSKYAEAYFHRGFIKKKIGDEEGAAVDFANYYKLTSQE